MSAFSIVPFIDGVAHATFAFNGNSVLVSVAQSGMPFGAITNQLEGDQRYRALLYAREMAQKFVNQATVELDAYGT